MIIFLVLFFSWISIPRTACISFSSESGDHFALQHSRFLNLSALFYNYMSSYSVFNGNKIQQKVSSPTETELRTCSTNVQLQISPHSFLPSFRCSIVGINTLKRNISAHEQSKRLFGWKPKYFLFIYQAINNIAMVRGNKTKRSWNN